MSVDDLRRRIQERIRLELANAPGLSDDRGSEQGPLPIRAKALGQDRPEELEEILTRWHTNPTAPPLALLSAPLGGGKTIATCSSQRTLTTADRVAVWIPMRDMPTMMAASELHPQSLIGALAGMNNASVEIGARDVTCAIFDGVDEFFSKGDEGPLLTTFSAVLQRLWEMRIPVLLSGRDIALGNSPLYGRIRELADALCRQRSFQEAMRLELLPSSDPEWRKALEGRLMKSLLPQEWDAHLARTGASSIEAAIHDQLKMMRHGVLESPLLFGMAHAVFRRVLRGESNAPTLRSAWDLTSVWLDECVDRDILRFVARTPRERRRLVAQLLALYLSITGNDFNGVSLDTLRDEAPWVWEPLTKVEGAQDAFESCKEELVHCCLLRVGQARFAPFHPGILEHLASEGLEAIVRGTYQARVMGKASPLKNPPWKEIGEKLSLPGMRNLGRILDCHVDGSAFRFGSTFRDVVSYFARHRFNKVEGPPVRLMNHSRIKGGDADSEEGELARRILGAASIMLEATTQKPNGTDDDPPLSVTVDGTRFRLLPKGTHLVWDEDKNGFPIPTMQTLKAPFLLAEKLVTVAQYARFLRDDRYRRVKPPDDPEVGWDRDALGNIIFNTECAGQPVRGVSHSEAQQYCAWLTQYLRERGQVPTILGGTVRSVLLPSKVHFAVAITDPSLVRIHWNEVGRAGHRDLVHFVPQHTNALLYPMAGGTGLHVEVFGGSERAGGVKDKAMPAADREEQHIRAEKLNEQMSITLVRQVLSAAREDFGIRLGMEVVEGPEAIHKIDPPSSKPASPTPAKFGEKKEQPSEGHIAVAPGAPDPGDGGGGGSTATSPGPPDPGDGRPRRKAVRALESGGKPKKKSKSQKRNKAGSKRRARQ